MNIHARFRHLAVASPLKRARVFLGALVVVLAISGNASALKIDFGTPVPSSILPGQELSVPILLTEVPANLAGLSFYVSYNPLAMLFDPFPPPTGTPSFVGNNFGIQTSDVPGFVNIATYYGDFSLLGNAFTLTNLNFIGLPGGGTSIFKFVVDVDHLAYADVYDPLTYVAQITPTFGGSTRANVVPEPGTWVLLGSGVLGLIGTARKRKAKLV